ncbi:MAG: hypothetical protein KIB51_10315 [Dysgonomonas mossii]|nr:hypothetical protein [Dysgonomonas mossii]
MTTDQLDKGKEIQLRLRDLATNKEKAEYIMNHLEMENESARSFIRLISPSDTTKYLDIKDVDFLKVVIAGYIAKVDTKIVELEEGFKAL